VSPIIRFGAVGVALLLGLFGFAQAYADAHIPTSFTQNALRAVRLIVGAFPAALEDRDLPVMLTIARFALPLLTFWSTVALAWTQLRNPVRVALIRARGEHLVIAGDDHGGLAAEAARHELQGGRRLLLWPRDRRATWVADAVEGGAAEVERGDEAAGVDSLALDKARAVLLLSAEARTNIALAGVITAESAAKRPAGDPLDVILRIDDLDLRRSVEPRFDAGDRKTARVRLASLPDIAARQLSLARPIDGFVRQGATGRRILVIGFSPLIERYVLRTLAGGHYRDGGKPAFFIHESGVAETEASFRARHPAADSLSPVTFVDARPDPARMAALIDGFVAARGEPVAILIDQADDDRALAIALSADARYRTLGIAAPPIHVRMDGGHDAALGAGIFPFGELASLAEPEMLLQDRHDALARSIHDFYLEGRFAEGERIGIRASMQEWENLSESFRDDNRLVADCYELKLRDIGARLVDGAGATLSLTGDELEQLSRAEHDRWMAAKLVQGWVHGPVRDDARRIHPDIVPYDELSEAIKDLDREQVRIMARLLAASGKRALRTLTVLIDPGAASPAEPLLAALATHYPDRAPLFLGNLDDAGSRATLLSLHQAGHAVQLALPGHAQAILDGLPGAEGKAASAMLRAADRLLAVTPDAAGRAWLEAQTDLILGESDDPRAIRVTPEGAITHAPWMARA
jgi:hypothetical protein